jgi:hypothetical protein
MPTQKRIALAAGHRNTSGGDAHEKVQTARLTPAIAAACRAAGFEVRVVQPDDGAGMFDGPLSEVAQTVVDWNNSDFPVDLFMEVHTEGAGGVRGSFVVFPDWDDANDHDQAARRLGQSIARRLHAETGVHIRGDGSMSEKDTQVGSEGDRLGVFRITAPLKERTTRMIYEFGAHDNDAKLAIVDAPEFAPIAAQIVAEEIAAFLGQSTSEVVNGITIERGFLELWRAIAPNVRASVLGPPLRTELDTRGTALATTHGVHAAQPFQRGWMVFQPNERPMITLADRRLWRDLEIL